MMHKIVIGISIIFQHVKQFVVLNAHFVMMVYQGFKEPAASFLLIFRPKFLYDYY